MLEIVYSAEEFERNRTTGEVSRTGQRHVLRFDAITQERHSATASLTEHAVERGASIADHKIRDNRSFSISCIVTDSPLGDPPPSGSRTRGITGRMMTIDVGGGQSTDGLVYSDTVTRVVDVFAELVDLVDRPVSVSVRTKLRVYTDMQVVGVSAPRTVMDGNAVEFVVDFRELRTSLVETTTAPQPKKPRLKGRATLGAQATEEPTETQKAASRSVLSSIFGGGS